MLIALNGVGKSFGSDIIFSNVTAKIENKDRIGFVGQNGAGKTTLLNIITNELEHDEGDIARSPMLSIGYQKQNCGLSQSSTITEEMDSVFADVYETEARLIEVREQMAATSDDEKLAELNKIYHELENKFLARDGYQVQTKINTVLNGMGFASHNRDKTIDKLSGGEQTRLAIAKLLLEQPALLILDEPTNHLDFKTLGWLEEYLSSYNGAILVVSHDRYFLDRLCDKIWEMAYGEMYTYKGNYTKYLQLKEERDTRQTKVYEEQQREIAKMQDYVARNLVRASTTKMAQSRQKMIDRIELTDKPKAALKAPIIKLEYDTEPVKDILKLEQVTVAVGQGDMYKELLTGLDFHVARGDKIAIIGDNGTGKTSLLKGIINNSTIPVGGVTWGRGVKKSYYEQGSDNMVQSMSVLDTMWESYPKSYETKLRSMLGALGLSGDDVFRPVSALSGGERARLKLAIICLAGSNVLIMDEPTNHLDLPTKEVLEKALAEFEGTVIMVSHDRYLLDKIPTRIAELKSGRMYEYKGRYRDYLNNTNSEPEVAETTTQEKPESENQKAYKRGKEARREEAKRRKDYAETEALIATLEAEIEEIQTNISNPDNVGNYELLQALCLEEQQKQEQLEHAMEKWLELAQ